MDQTTFDKPGMPDRKSPAEIEELKRQWVADAIWDIEDTEGFEAHREELLAYRKECERAWAFEEMQVDIPGEYINTEERIIDAAQMLDDWNANDNVSSEVLLFALASSTLAMADAMERIIQRLDRLITAVEKHS